MSDDFSQELGQDFAQTAQALAPIVDDETTFRLLVQSFRAQDHEGFRDMLARFDLFEEVLEGDVVGEVVGVGKST